MPEQKGVNLAAENPHVMSFDATIQSVEGHDVVIDRTYFYAEAGGQPADRGTLGGVDVIDVQKRGEETIHRLAHEPEFEPGDSIAGSIDESFRTYTMRAHTASHVVYGAGRKLFDAQGYGGFDIGTDRIRIDFKTTGPTDEVDPITIERMVNEAVWDSRSVEWYEMDIQQARSDDEIAINLDDAELADTVRIVEIDDWDISACGGTHVANTAEVGFITVLDTSNPGEDLFRVEFAVGPPAIQQRVDEQRATSRAARTLDTSIENLAQRVEGLVEDNKTLRTECEELTEQLLNARLAALAENTYTRNGKEWLVGTIDNVGPNDVADHIRPFDTAMADVIVLAGTNGSTFVVVGTDGTQDATDILVDLTTEFGGGGGGQPTLAQGGGLNADPHTVLRYVTES